MSRFSRISRVSVLLVLFLVISYVGEKAGVASLQAAGIDATQPEPFIRQILQYGVSTLNDATKPKEEKERVFRNLLTMCFDIKSIAVSSLGPRWRTLDPATRENYLKLFEAMVFRVYMDQLEQLTLKDFQIMSVVDIGDGGKKVITSIQRSENPEPVTVEWVIFLKNNLYSVLEVIIATVPVSNMMTREIADSISRNGGEVSGMLTELQQRYGKDVRP